MQEILQMSSKSPINWFDLMKREVILSGPDVIRQALSKKLGAGGDASLLFLKKQIAKLWRGPNSREQWAASRRGPHPYNCKALNSSNNQWAWKKTQSLKWDWSPLQQPLETLLFWRAHCCAVSRLLTHGECEIRNVSYSELLNCGNLWNSIKTYYLRKQT